MKMRKPAPLYSYVEIGILFYKLSPVIVFIGTYLFLPEAATPGRFFLFEIIRYISPATIIIAITLYALKNGSCICAGHGIVSEPPATHWEVFGSIMSPIHCPNHLNERNPSLQSSAVSCVTWHEP